MRDNQLRESERTRAKPEDEPETHNMTHNTDLAAKRQQCCQIS